MYTGFKIFNLLTYQISKFIITFVNTWLFRMEMENEIWTEFDLSTYSHLGFGSADSASLS